MVEVCGVLLRSVVPQVRRALAPVSKTVTASTGKDGEGGEGGEVGGATGPDEPPPVGTGQLYKEWLATGGVQVSEMYLTI